MERWGEITQALSQLSWWSAPLSICAAAAAVLAIFRSWLAIVWDTGLRLSAREALSVFGVGQIGKYLPGSVWSVLGPAHLVRGYGASAVSMATATLVSLMISVFVAIALGALLLPIADVSTRSLWFAPFVAVGLGLLLIPRVLNGMVRLAAAVLRRPLLGRPVSLQGVVSSVAWACLANALFGLHVLALGHDFGLSDLRGFLLAVSAFALAAGIGVLVVIAPAGAGARDGVLVLVLASSMATTSALTIALLSRLITMVVEFGLAISQLRSTATTSWRDRGAAG